MHYIIKYNDAIFAQMKEGFAGGEADSHVSDSDFESPLHGVNHVIYFAQAMQGTLFQLYIFFVIHFVL